MNKLLLVFFVSLTAFAYGQNTSDIGFDIMDFNSKMKTAEWLYRYDIVAWHTSDSVMAQDPNEIKRLGNEWFCFERNGSWHAIYGKYEVNKFDLVFHFKISDDLKVNKTNEAVDTTLLHRYARALQTANNELKSIKDTVNLRFNQYIKENEDQTFTVWILPAFQPNNVAVYGAEFIYTIDYAGTRIIDDKSYYQGQFKGFKVGTPREIGMDFTEIEKPTLGSIFFAWYYKSYFTKILIENSKSISTPFQSNGTWTWIHAKKE
ncbi:hypothetical protein [Sphingobacterium yanglingense]|uniref:Uncharacterized protein n=1 Tax=Sphingobacterium yanglingense TaxID=1437280 RepID=A0A4R6WEY3_9SPHI|nr:hypothetical protein [Sphingobacterium yanglingense]TDQ78313.1 hypothetical protein CLV99_2295 [Sphingobacterium yanglingense]